MALVSSIDTYYAWVAKQLQTVDSSLVSSLKGVVLAQDWPQLQIDDGEIYLLYLNSAPIGGTKAFPLYKHFLQWGWILLGDDIQPDQVAANRGDRYRKHMTIQESLKQASYPGFAWKVDASADAQGNVTLQPVDPIEMVQWTNLKMPTKWNQKAGVIYGYAAVEVDGYDATLPSTDNVVQYPPVPTV